MWGFTERIIALIVGRELAEQHQRWCIKKEKDYLRSLSPTKPLPITLHAAKHQRSLNYGTCSLKQQPPVSSAPSTVLTAPCPSIEATVVMPHRHYSNVQSHYATLPVNEAPGLTDVSEVMQTYNYGQLETSHRVDFNLHQDCNGVCIPPRKRTDLEQLPPLSDKLAEEIEHKNQVMEQAAIYAQIREKQEEKTEKRRRSSTAQQFPLPPFRLCLDGWHPSDYANLVDPLTTQTTPESSPTRERMRQPRVGLPEALPDLAGNLAGQPHVQWAPNLIQQKQKQALAPHAQRPASPNPMPGRRRSSNGPSNLRKVTTLIAE